VTVAKTSSVPFLVEAGRVIVHDLGTAFDVRLTDAAVGVVVTEGKVRVLTQAGEAQPPIDLVELTAGQSALIHDAPSAAAVRVESLPAADSSQTLRWQAHHLVFERTPLAEVIRQVNRYNVRQLVMADDSLQSVELAGGIEATNLDAVVGLLESGFKIRAERRGNVILLHR